jgi:hypothetical protein
VAPNSFLVAVSAGLAMANTSGFTSSAERFCSRRRDTSPARSFHGDAILIDLGFYCACKQRAKTLAAERTAAKIFTSISMRMRPALGRLLRINRG